MIFSNSTTGGWQAAAAQHRDKLNAYAQVT